MSDDEPELTVAETIQSLIRNDGGRYVLIGTDENAKIGRLIIFDTKNRSWIYIDENEGANADLIFKMLAAGARVHPKAPEA